MSTALQNLRVRRALAVSIAILSIFMIWGSAAATAQAVTVTTAGAVATDVHTDQAVGPPEVVRTAAARSYCHSGSRPVYSCGPYDDYYLCDATAEIFEMLGFWTSTCWYFPHGNLGGGPGYYF